MSRLNISIPSELNDMLTIVAKELDRSKSYIASKAIEAFLYQYLKMDVEKND